MAIGIAELAEKKCIVVTGKGGSGKSLLSLALAHRLSSEGKRVWLVELGRRRDHAFTRLPALIGAKNAGHSPTLVTLPKTKQKIWLSVLDPAQSLAEYVDIKLPTGGLAGMLLGNRVTASFLEVVPGLPELVSLGKLWHSATHPQPETGPDVVVLDAPATGHAVALLKAPANFRRITKVGPIFRDASRMAEFFADPALTAVVASTLPEEMSLRETDELKKLLGREFPSPFVFVNRRFPSLEKVELKETLPYKAYEYSRLRAEREEEAVRAFGSVQGNIPFFFPDPAAPPLYLRISEAL